MLLIGELKEIRPMRSGMKATIKHLPGQPFALSDELYQSVCRRYSWELSQWAESDRMHIATIATFMLDEAGVPSIDEMSLMATCNEWIPVQVQSIGSATSVSSVLGASGSKRHLSVTLRMIERPAISCESAPHGGRVHPTK